MTTKELYTQLQNWIGRVVEICHKPGSVEMGYHGKRDILSEVAFGEYDGIIVRVGNLRKSVYAEPGNGSIVLKLIETLADRIERESQELKVLSDEIETKQAEQLDKIDKLVTLNHELRAQEELEKFPTPDGWSWGDLVCHNEVVKLNGPKSQELLIIEAYALSEKVKICLTDDDGDIVVMDIEPVRAALARFDAERQDKSTD